MRNQHLQLQMKWCICPLRTRDRGNRTSDRILQKCKRFFRGKNKNLMRPPHAGRMSRSRNTRNSKSAMSLEGINNSLSHYLHLNSHAFLGHPPFAINNLSVTLSSFQRVFRGLYMPKKSAREARSMYDLCSQFRSLTHGKCSPQ